MTLFSYAGQGDGREEQGECFVTLRDKVISPVQGQGATEPLPY